MPGTSRRSKLISLRTKPPGKEQMFLKFKDQLNDKWVNMKHVLYVEPIRDSDALLTFTDGTEIQVQTKPDTIMERLRNARKGA